MTPLQDIMDTFQSVDDELRVQLLLDYADRLSPIPQRLRAERDGGLHRVQECQTPVFLWVECNGGGVHIHADVAEESPTVRGFLSILVHACEGQPPEQVAALPDDLLNRLGLANLIRMTRMVGLSAVLTRIKREAATLTQPTMSEQTS